MSGQGEKNSYLTTYEQFLLNRLSKPTPEATLQTDAEEKIVDDETFQKETPPPELTSKPIHDEPVDELNCKRKLTKRKSPPYCSSRVKSAPQRNKLRKKSGDSNQEADECSSSVSNETYETDSSDGYLEVLEEKPLEAYECQLCSFETIYQQVFRDHMLTHKRQKSFHQCPKCTFKVACRAIVGKHTAINEPDGRVVYCGLYAYSHECRGVLDAHMAKHKNEDKGGDRLKH